MIRLRWAAAAESDVVSYKVHRSVVGVHAHHVDQVMVEGDSLILSVDGKAPQTILFSGPTPAVDQINAQLRGARAVALADSEDGFLLRSNTKSAPGSLEVIGGTALDAFMLDRGLRTERSEWHTIAEILVSATADITAPLTMTDPDGLPEDYYQVTAVSSTGEESRPTPPKKASQSLAEVCVIHGAVVSLSGYPVPDLAVKATLMVAPTDLQGLHISKKPVVALTDAYGNFSIALLQGASVLLEIEDIGYSRTFTVPALDFVVLPSVESDFDYRFPLQTEV